ncbi:MAG: DNA primase [Planctomycetota bacterium]|jgi:DNA primase
MSNDLEFRRAIEEIKSRTSLEDVVGECVDGDLVNKSGRLWACCPFHDESTPSFAIGPDPGLWYCFGACREGGDLLAFVMRQHSLTFMDALELLATRSGITLPKRQGRGDREGGDEGLRVLKEAEAHFVEELRSSRGAGARQYLQNRGMDQTTLEVFGVGLAPANGQGLVNLARQGGGSVKPWEGTGLVRERDGRRYDFFRGRLMIPIRDHRGRTIAFGGRRLQDDEQAGPKYVNTPETDWFKKGSVIYGYDRALDAIRRSHHAILMEGYTDVLAAHQAGIFNACAVLGTATTEQHAALLRRAAAKRVSLIFDGDEAGRRAAWRAIEGLLPLDIELEVVRPPAGQDPADLLAGGDAQPFLAHLEQAQPWFDFVTAPLKGLRGRDLSRGVDEVLKLLSAVPKPVYQDALLAELAEALGMPVQTLRDQWQALSKHSRRPRPEPRPAQESQPSEASAKSSDASPALPPPSRRVQHAYWDAIGAALVDTSLIPRVQPLLRVCPLSAPLAILSALCILWDDDDAELSVSAVLTVMGENSATAKVSPLVEYVRQAESPSILLDGALELLKRDIFERQLAEARALVAELERDEFGPSDPDGVLFVDSSAPHPIWDTDSEPTGLESTVDDNQDTPSETPQIQPESPQTVPETQTVPEPQVVPETQGASGFQSASGHPAGHPVGHPTGLTLQDALAMLARLLRDGPDSGFPTEPPSGEASAVSAGT